MDYVYEVMLLDMVMSELAGRGIDIIAKVNVDAREEFSSRALFVTFFPNPCEVRNVEGRSLLADALRHVHERQ